MQVIINGLIAGGIYAVFAIGFNFIYSTVRFFNLAYGAIALFGAYFTLYLQIYFDLNFALAAFFGAILTGLVGLIVWIFVYQPLRKRKASDLIMLVSSFGILLILQNVIAMLFTNYLRALSISNLIKPGYEFFGLFITFNQIVILTVSFFVIIILTLFLKKTRLGLMMRAIGENVDLAMSSGIPVKKITYVVVFMGTVMSAFACILTSLEIGVRPQYAMLFVLKAIVASIIGGLGSLSGALFGGLILGIIENLGISYFGLQWQEVVGFGLLTVFLIFRPQGLISSYKKL